MSKLKADPETGTKDQITPKKTAKTAPLTDTQRVSIEELALATKELQAKVEELQRTNDTLVRINEDLNNFVFAASHDLLGPLDNIEASLGGIQHRMTEEDDRVFLQIIDTSVKNFSGLIKEMAVIAHLENDSSNTELVDIAGMIEEIKWSIANKFVATGAIIVTDLEVKQILFAKKNLRSILYNLIYNAIKFRREEPLVIKVTTRQNENGAIMLVEDNGIGIAHPAMQKIFSAYGRLSGDIEGNGIGLYLVKKMIGATGGEILVKSDLGKGTEFIISFNDAGQATPTEER